MSNKNIYQRINEVMTEVEYVQKDATITGGGSYAGCDTYFGLCRELVLKLTGRDL